MTIGSKLLVLAGAATLPTDVQLTFRQIKAKFDQGEILSISEANLIDESYNIYIDKD